MEGFDARDNSSIKITPLAFAFDVSLIESPGAIN
jgi:hypothetical protein